jgi:hypothetical protein
MWHQEGFSFRLCVTAIDSAGAVSGPSNIVTIVDDGDPSERFESSKRQKDKAYKNHMRSGAFDGVWIGRDETGNPASFQFSKSTFHFSSGDSSAVGFIAADHRSWPGTLFLEFGPHEWTFGIYDLGRRWLQLCVAPRRGQIPSGFKPGSGAHVYYLTRQDKR